MIGHRLTARNDAGLVVIRLILEAGPEPGAACLAASPNGVVIQSGRPQVGIVQVVRRTVWDELALHPCGSGHRLKEGALIKNKPTGQESANENSATREEEKKEILPQAGGWRESTAPCHTATPR